MMLTIFLAIVFCAAMALMLISCGFGAGGASEFVREYTLASGGPYCDCGYKKKRG